MQTAAVQELVEQVGRKEKISVSRAMRESKLPYTIKTAKTPKKLTESRGFREVCEHYGLTDELILKSLSEDIEKKPQDRVAELRLGAQIKRMIVETSENKNININTSLAELIKSAENEN